MGAIDNAIDKFAQTLDERKVRSIIQQERQYNPRRAIELEVGFRSEQQNRDSVLYNPYSSATNRSVANLNAYGVDTSKIDDNFFRQNDYLRQYLIYNGTTNSPSKPGAKATAAQKAAYEYYQIWKSEEATTKAENQWEQLQRELTYWTQQKDRNYSDEEVLARIDWDKYSELVSMDKNKYMQPNEYNRAIGYSRDAMLATIWKARNPDFNGTIEDAMVGSYLGVGNQYKRDDELYAKLDAGNKQTYSPYSVGSTMEDERLYFCVPSFDRKWIDDHRAEIANGGDDKAKKYFENVVEAVEYTEKLNEQLKNLHAQIDDMLNNTDSPNAEWIIKTIKAMDSDFGDLFDLDATLEKSLTMKSLKQTASAVDYRWADIEKMIRERCAEANNRPNVLGMTTGLITDTGEDNAYRKTIEANWNREHPFADVEKNYNGTIDLNNRKVLLNPDGSISTESSFSTEIDGKEVLLPTIIDGKRVSKKEAVDHYFKTGEHLGIFDTPEEADEFAQRLHERQDAYYNKGSEPQKPPVFTETEQAEEDEFRKRFGDIYGTVSAFGTPSEKTAYMTGATSYYDQCVERLRNSDFAVGYEAQMTSTIAKRYGENFSVTSGYENVQGSMQEKQKKLDEVNTERGKLQDRKNTMEAIGNLSPNQYQNLVSYVTNTDEDFEFLLNTIRGNENQDARLASARDLYYLVTGESANGPQEETLQKAESWVKFLDAGRADPYAAKAQGEYYKPLTVEESARLDTLNRWRDQLDSEIKQDSDYLTAHEKEYSDAKLAIDFDRRTYTKACELSGNMDSGLFRKIENVYSAAQKATKEEYAPITSYDYNVANGETTREQATQTAILDATNAAIAYDELVATYKELQDAGVQFDAESKKNIEARIKWLQTYGKMASYVALDGAEDFQTVVDEMVEKTASLKGGHSLTEMLLANFLKTGNEIKLGLGDTLPEDIKSITAISKEEASRYFYLLNSDPKAAEEYITYLCDPNYGMLTIRAMQKLEEDAYAFASQPGLNPYIATVLGLGAYVVEAPQAMWYRASQAIKGEKVSQFNSAYDVMVFKNAAVKGAKDAIIKSSKQLFGDNSFVENGLTRMYDIGFGGGELAIGSMTMGGLFEGLGVPLGSLASSFAEKGIVVKIVESAAEVLPSTITSAEEKYRSVLAVTNDEDKAAKMYNVSLLSGLLTHSVIMTGMHSTYQSNPQGLTSAITNMFEKIISNDAAIGASTLASATINEFVDKAVMEQDSQWQADVNKFHNEYHYPLAIAEQMADQAMWQRVADQTWDSIINSTIRTAAMTGVGYLGGKIEQKAPELLEKIKDKASVLKNYYTESHSFDWKDAPYTAVGDVANANLPNSLVNAPKDAIINPLNSEDGTVMYDRTTGKAHNVVAILATENGNVLYIDKNGEQVPIFNIMLTNGSLAGNLTDDEADLLRYGVEYASTKYAPNMSTGWTYGSNQTGQEAEPTTTSTGIVPVGGSYQSAERPVSSGSLIGLPGSTGDDVTLSMIQPKGLQTFNSMFSASQTGASVALTSLLNSGDRNADKAASQIIVGDIGKGDPKLTAMTMLQIAQHNGLNDAVDAALTSGAGNSTLRAMFNAVASGKQLTDKTVNFLKEKVAADRKADPKGFNNAKQAKVTELLVANKTNEIVAQNSEPVKAAEQSVDDAKTTLAFKQKEQSEAEEKKKTAIQKAETSIRRFKKDPKNTSAKAKMQQDGKAAAGANALVEQKKNEVAIQKEKVAKEQKKLAEAQAKVETDARSNAQAIVAQEQEAQAQQKRESTAFKPHLYITERVPSRTDPDKLINKRDSRGRAIKKTVTVYDDQGKAVNLIGVYDSTRTQLVYMTDDGRLVTEGDPSTRETGPDGEVRSVNHRKVGDVIALGEDKDLDAAINDIQSRRRSSKTRHPAITPLKYLSSSFPINANGETVQIIGIAGKQTTDNFASPVLMGIDGKLYTFEDKAVEAQVDKFRQHGYIIMQDMIDLDDQGKLPEIPDDKITHIEEANESARAEREVQAVQNPVQGNARTGNNRRKLAKQSGQDVGRGDNGDAEHRPTEGDVGGTQESPSGYNRQEESRRVEILRDLIAEHIPTDENGHPKTVDDPHVEIVTDYQRFSDALNAAKANNGYGLFVDPQSPEELEKAGAIMYLSPDGKSGFAVGTIGEKKGNIFAVFSDPTGTARGVMPYLITIAIMKGGNKLDCYDGFLSDQYAKYGFIPVAKVPFSKLYADKKWNYARDGEPYVVVWMHNGDSPETVAQRYGKRGEEKGGYKYFDKDYIENLPTFTDTLDAKGNPVEGEDGYSKALHYRDNLMKTYNRGDGLVISHGIKVDEFVKAIKAGGFFAPSIGISREGVPSGVFTFGRGFDKKLNRETGPVIVLFGEKTIDPKTDERNAIYSSDAYTPTVDYLDVDNNGNVIDTRTGEVLSKEDAVKAMFEAKADSAVIARKYKSLDDMKADSGRIVQTSAEVLFEHPDPNSYLDNAGIELFESLPEETKDALLQKAVSDKNAVSGKPIVDLDDSEHSALDNGPVEIFTDTLAKIIPQAYHEGMTAEEMQKLLADNGFNVSVEAAGKYLDELDKSALVLSDYFEAKPKRFVPLSEGIGFLVPKENPELVKMLTDAGVPDAVIGTHDGKNVQEKAASLLKALTSADKSKAPKATSKPVKPKKSSGTQLTGLLNVSQTIQKAKAESSTPKFVSEGIASMLSSGDKDKAGIEQKAASTLVSLCNGDSRLAKNAISACLKNPTIDEANTKRDLVYALSTDGRGRDALVDLIRMVENGEEITDHDVDNLQLGLQDDYTEDHSVFDSLGEEETDEPVHETGSITTGTTGNKALDNVMNGLGLSIEYNDEDGVSTVVDVNGNEFGDVYEDGEGHARIHLSGNSIKAPIIKSLKVQGFTFDDQSKEWVSPTVFENDEDTPENANDMTLDSTGDAKLDTVMNRLGLSIESNDENGVSELVDFRGERFGEAYSDGNGYVSIRLDEGYDTPTTHQQLEESGFTLDGDEWVTTPRDVNPDNTPTPSGNVSGLERITQSLGLNVEEPQPGVRVLTDVSGETVGYLSKGDDGIERIDFDPRFETEDVRKALADAGYVYDDNAPGGWIQASTPNAVTPESTPPAVNPPSTPPSVNPPAGSPPTPPTSNPPTPPTVIPSGEQKERQWNVKGAQQSDILSDKAKARLMKNRWYTEDHNEDQFNRATEWIKNHATESDPTGLYGALNDLESGELNLLNVDNHVRLMVAIAMASEAGDEDAVARLSDGLFASSSTEIAQALQASKIWMTMNPTGRKIALKREADRIRDAYLAKGKNLRFGEGQKSFRISDEALEAAANAETEEEFLKARRMMEMEIAKQIPSDMQLRLRTFRMTSMLANPRTHLRNIIGNITGALMVEAKNAIGTGIEFAQGVPKEQRQKTIVRTKESVQFALDDFPKMKDTLQGGNKFFEMSEVERNRKAFGSGKGKTAFGRALSKTVGKQYQKFADWSSDKLEKEDVIFLKYHYTRALSGYMSARSLTPEQMKGKTLAEARAYAVQEAQKATYRSANQLATWLNSIQWKPARKTIDAIQPFVKTPSNIVKMGFEYSPAGLVRALKTSVNGIRKYQEWEKGGFKGKRPHGAISPAEAADKISAGLTGTAIAGIGAWLFAMGILKVKATDAEKRNGAQDYSLEIGGKSYGIGNLVPFNIPLMLGATLYDEFTSKEDPITGFKDGDYAKGAEQVFARVLDGVKDIAEPVVDTTMMSSLNSLLNTSSYSSGDLTLGTLAEKVMANYVSSYFPSFIGAVAKTVDPTRRKAFTESGDKLQIWKAMWEQTVNKTPFLSTMNVPYINAWGEEENLTHVEAFLQNFVFPDKIQTLGDGELDALLEQLSTKASTNLQPSNAKSISVNGNNVKLNDQQWYQYNSVRGKLSKATLQELIERPEFITLSDYPEVQAELIKKVYKYAKAKAATEVFAEKEVKDGWTRGALATDSVVDYIFEKEEESAREASNDVHRESLYNSVVDCNADAAKMDISFLRQGGVKDENIRSSLTRKIKPLYQEMYNNGDYDGIVRLEAFLDGLEIGYTDKIFAGWLK